MKKIFAIILLLCLTMTRAAAYEWTDGNGVTWKFSRTTFTINGTSQQLWYIEGASGYGENVTVPSVVYNGSTACTVEAVSGITFSNGTNVTLPTTIKYISNLFGGSSTGTVKINNTTPPTINSLGGNSVTVLVPAASLNAYRTADVWKDRAVNIISQSAKTTYSINTTAQSSSSAIHQTIGEDNLINVISLTVTGSINSYDILIMRNKMHNLHHLDLTNANIVANSYPYYGNYYTTDNVLGYRAFYEMYKLFSVKLPNSVTTIGDDAFRSCSSLASVTIPNSVTTIGNSAFYSCSSLASVTIPNSVTTIGADAFRSCSSLASVTIPNSVTTIGNLVFFGCSSLASVTIPNSVTTIGGQAFGYCSSLKEIHIPSNIRSIGEMAFYGCTNLKDYYTYTIEPTSISESTFSNWTSATLHIPTHAYNNYYWDTQWSKFAHLVQDNDYQYEYFYLTQDYVFDDNNGAMSSTPTVQLDAGSGLVINTTNSTVKLDEVFMDYNGSVAASIVANNNLTVNKLYYEMEVTKNKWYFVSFPFRVKLSNVTSPGNYVFRYYDGQTRAQNGSGGWKNVTGSYLNAHQGYIFQTNTTGILKLKVEKADMNFSGSDMQDALNNYASSNTQNASWNFVGNPHPCYFNLNETGYTAPITVWNGSTYQAVRAGDDAFYMHPFQAFFVQKPEGTPAISFPASGRKTYLQTVEEQTAAAARQASTSTIRKIVNLTICSGENVDDQTRVVYNDATSADYEMDCDAAKFFADGQVTQLYTLDAQGTQYAINERPRGEVPLGYTAAKEGNLTISAVRMDCPVYLRDNELNIVHDLSQGGYTFTAEAGTNEQRFTLVMGNATGIVETATEPEINGRTIYTLGGVRLPEGSKPTGTYIVKEGHKTTKVMK